MVILFVVTCYFYTQKKLGIRYNLFSKRICGYFVVSALFIPISLVIRGLAGKVFEEVRQQGAKVVMKNNAPECVLLSPEEYLRLIDEVNDAKLAALAAQRMQHFDADKAIPAEEVYQKYGISDADLADFDEVEFE